MSEQAEHLEALARHNEQTALRIMEVAIGHKVTVTPEDCLRGAIIEALWYLDNHAPSRAHDVLQTALNQQPKETNAP